MKVAIASDDGKNIAAHTGRCACFVIYDVQNAQIAAREVRPNAFTPHAQGECDGEPKGAHRPGGGSGRHESLLSALSDCEVFICRGMGPRLVADLQQGGVRVIFCGETNADEVASKFTNGTLQALDSGECEKY
jgi:predicted Fe-Mo cluster-binding NifX family protein